MNTMKPTNVALHTLLLLSVSAPATAFAPPNPRSSLDGSSLAKAFGETTTSTSLAAYVGEDYGAVPPRGGRREEDAAPPVPVLKEYAQRLSADERKANLEVMKQIYTQDLAVLLRRRDYAGWIEAKRELRKRQDDDPWFELNDRMKEAVQMGEDDEAAEIQTLIDQVGGPPPGVKHRRQYAVITEIYDAPMSLSRAESIVRTEQIRRNREIHQRRVAERTARERKEEEEARFDPMKEDREAAERRDVFINRVYKKLEESKKDAVKRAGEIAKDDGDSEEEVLSPIEQAWAVAKRQAEETRLRRKKRSLEKNKDAVVASDDPNVPESERVVEPAPLAAAATATRGPDGRPRVPGDRDMTRGEIAPEHVSETSDVTTGRVRVSVSCSYNRSESEPAARRHTFCYTVEITNLDPEKAIRLTRRRFEIQTVGASKKDLVEGDGVTGRRPILKPGETFKYTSLAPLNVRPLGTTIAAARMRGTYFYDIVSSEETSADAAHEEGEAELGTFHFVFPPEQRVQPFQGSDADDEDEDDEE